jgi:hypothetical protein
LALARIPNDRAELRRGRDLPLFHDAFFPIGKIYRQNVARKGVLTDREDYGLAPCRWMKLTDR